MPDMQWVILTLVVPAVIWLAKMARDGQLALKDSQLAFLSYLQEASQTDREERGKLRQEFREERDLWRGALDQNTEANIQLLVWLKAKNGGE